ncbi:MAG: putative ABC transporter permease [Bacilli bacterium]|jgi:uncharacterized membrane protein|nr:putative ABC transporter permease [Bacilli bacterium]
MSLLDHGYNLILIYLLMGLVGNLYETILYLVREHRFVMSNGSVTTPFNFVYGCGGVLVCLVLSFIWTHPFAVYFVSALLGGVAEYTVASLERWICHTKSWDYSGRILNIGGKTTVPIMLLWGILGMVSVYFFYIPLVANVINPYFLDTSYHALCYHATLLAVGSYVILDLIFTLMVMVRHQKRHDKIPPKTPLGRLIDDKCNDHYMSIHFPNAKFPDQNKKKEI